MDKRGQLESPVVWFIIMIIGIIILAPFALMIFNKVNEPLQDNLNNLSGGQQSGAASAVGAVLGNSKDIWDEASMFAILGLLLVLIVSSIFIDTHPIWLIVYILTSVFIIIAMPAVQDTLNTVYDSQLLDDEVNDLTMLDFLQENFTMIVVGIMVFTGIIIFGKISLFRGGSRP